MDTSDEMLKKAMEVDLISQFTGLSKQELNQLKADLWRLVLAWKAEYP